MKKMSECICKHKMLIIIIGILLLIPSLIGIYKTKINYDILVYLPEDIETIKAQNILADDFHMGAFAFAVVEDTSSKQLLEIEDYIRSIESVGEVLSIDDITGTSIPIEMLPSEITNKLAKENTKLLVITFSGTTSEETTLNAVEEIRNLGNSNIKLGGMSSMVLDTMNISDSEVVIYIVIAVILCIIVLMISLDSYFVPFILLANIGLAILYNMGSNIFLGEISYITKAISAVLQLGVTTDFSIFLYHKYENLKENYNTKEEAMSIAITETLTSVLGSSFTTIAGFLALCTMSLTLGKDIGIVMAKGVMFGVICVVTLFPALLLVFDKLIEKTHHKVILPKFNRIKNLSLKHYKLTFVIFLLLIIPALYGYNNTKVYYNLDSSLPDYLASRVANSELKEKYNLVSPEIILVNKDLSNEKINEMLNEIKQLDGIDMILSFSSISELGIPTEMLPEKLTSMFQTDQYKAIIVNSLYDIATNELNDQIADMTEIVKKYDSTSLVAGEGPLMKDLIKVSDNDFKSVNNSSIFIILIIMILVLKSISLPVLLIVAIEFAIFINMGVPYYTNVEIPFISSIVLGTIQLGATIDYAILMTTKYLEQRKKGIDKITSMHVALDSSVSSIIVSGMCFFAATFGVGVYSKLEMIASICTLISRGAIISVLVVIFLLPSLILIFDKLIINSSLGFKEMKKMKKNKNIKKMAAFILCISILMPYVNVSALTKDETVYIKLNNDGSTKNTIVSEHLINDNLDTIEDLSTLTDILNVNGDETFTKSETSLIWNANKKDIFYQGKTEKENPIAVSITYQLDGKDISISDLENKSGHITETIKFTNKDAHTVSINGTNETLYTPFVVTTGMILDATSNHNIKVSCGEVINTGKKATIIAISAPGLYESLKLDEVKGMDTITIEYDTDSFSTNSMYSVVTPKIIDTTDLNVFSKLDSLYANANTIQESINKIEEGAKELTEGASKLNSGASLIYENLNTISNKVSEVVSGISSVNNGLTTMITALTNTKQQLQEQDNTAKKEQLTYLINQNKNTITLLTKTNESLEETYVNYDLQNQDLATLQSLNETLATVKKTYESNTSLITLLNANNTALESSLASIDETTNSILSLIDNVSENITKLQTGTNSLLIGTTTIATGSNQLASKTGELSSGVNELYNGSETLYQGIKTFNEEGIKKITNYINGNIKGLSNRVKALVRLSDEYNTFDIKSADTTGKTKFIIIVEK